MAKYPLYWALSVVNRDLEKHARVSASFLDFLGLSSMQLAKILADARPEWPILRDMLKVLDNWSSRLPNDHTRVWYFGELVRMYTVKMPVGLRLYLDSRVKSLRIEEQGEKGGLPAPTGAGGPRHLGVG